MLEQFAFIASSGENILNGSKVIMDMQGREITPTLICKVWKSFIEPTGASVVSWVLNGMSSRECMKRLGMNVGEPLPVFEEDPSKKGNKGFKAISKGLLHIGAIRRGQTLTYKGDIIIIGNVHAGAEVYAGGHIVVLGKLMGLTHAGCDGDTNMSVSARSYGAGQILVGGKTATLINRSDLLEKPLTVTCDGENLIFSEWP